MEIVPLRAFDDNYIWLLRAGSHAAVVDPGDAAPVLDYLDRHALTLAAVLVTHHHRDHVGGVDDLLVHAPVPVFGPGNEGIRTVSQPLSGGERIVVPGLAAGFEVLAVPGHTRGHLAYYGANIEADGALFCGDTLFACGCGRVFEGTMEQMQASLAKLAGLPPATRVYCAHEYTKSNLVFAAAVEPDSAAIRQRSAEVAALHLARRPTLPSTIARELETNPFLRWDAPAVIEAARRRGASVATPVEIFAAIRNWKNVF